MSAMVSTTRPSPVSLSLAQPLAGRVDQPVGQRDDRNSSTSSGSAGRQHVARLVERVPSRMLAPVAEPADRRRGVACAHIS